MRKKPDKVKALLLERKRELKLTDADLANMLGCCRQSMTKKWSKPSEEWLTEAYVLAYALDVPLEDFRAAISY